MHESHSAAQRVATVKVCGNVSRIIGEALSHWHRSTNERIAVAEKTKLPGWQYLVHQLHADQSVASEFFIEVNRLHATLHSEAAQDAGHA